MIRGDLVGLLAALVTLCPAVQAEDGYRLWLRFEPLPEEHVERYRTRVSSVLVSGDSATLDLIRAELTGACTGLLGHQIPLTAQPKDGAVVVGTPSSSPLIADLGWTADLQELGPEGYRIRSLEMSGRKVTLVASMGEVGALYGTYHLIRLLQTLRPLSDVNIDGRPRLQLRLLNHWDNLDGSIERGYAGRSLWDWDALPTTVGPRLTDYARANASVGINGTALNSVNADSRSLSPEYLRKTAAIADVFRPYGIRVYLSARFSAPIELGGLETADPLNSEVERWWHRKADEIYQLIPDFGGFLVKANSEGQPGPRTYGRTHVAGANLLAGALEEHGGVVLWRAFIYDMKPGYDRAAAAYDSLQPFDGQFASNVLLQVKNGPIDFQPREPFHPLFGAMPRTRLIPELQITQEYLGFSNHLVFLAPMWREFLDSDTYARGPGSTVARVIDGTLYGLQPSGIAGVANTGDDRNWTGHHFAQSNWYAFGRLAWNPEFDPRQIAHEWIQMTWTQDEAAVRQISRIMLESHEAAVNYMTPLGLHHIMAPGHHYGPAPWWDQGERRDWTSVYYHRADEEGLGFDRTETGSNAVAQYHRPVRDRFKDPATCPEKFLLWFHHLPWDFRLKSGTTLWDGLATRYQSGVDWTRRARRVWEGLSAAIDQRRHREVSEKLAIQERDAIWWRDAVLLYFQRFSKQPLPAGVEEPRKTLREYRADPPDRRRDHR